MSEYATIVIIAYAIFGVVILGVLYLFYKSVKSGFADLHADIKRLDSKLDTNFAYLEAKIDSATDTLRSEMNAGFARLEAKVERKFNAMCSTVREGSANQPAKLDAVDATVDSTPDQTRRQD